MLTIKVRVHHEDLNMFTWNTFSAVQHMTDFSMDHEGVIQEFMEIQDAKGEWHRVDFLPNVAVFVENLHGKTVEKFNYLPSEYILAGFYGVI